MVVTCWKSIQCPMSTLSAFDELCDPRQPHLIKYELKSLVFITISAVLSGFETFTEIALFSAEKRDWITRFVPLPEAHTPSHDVFGDLYASLCPEQFSQCFVSWVSQVSQITSGELIAIDGKTLRGSFDKHDKKAAIHMVSAWSAENGLALGQVKTDDKSNEITAIPALLELLETSGAIISIDAMGCQKSIAKKIIDRKADYILALKSNQPALMEQVLGAFDAIEPASVAESIEKGHGRIETRKCTLVTDLGLIDETLNWPSLNAVVRIESTREDALSGTRTTQTRYYISSLKAPAQRFNQLIRQHWGIENTLHWTLDVTFAEDRSRIRRKNGDQNFATIRRIAFNILKLNQAKQSMNVKRKKAGINDSFREELLRLE